MSSRDLPSHGSVGGSYVFSDADFGVIARRAQQDFGLHLTEAKKDLVYSRLTKRLRQLGMADFHDYVRLLEAGSRPNGCICCRR